MNERAFRKATLTSFAGGGFILAVAILVIAVMSKSRGIFGGAVVCAVFAYFFWLLGWQSAVRITSAGVIVDNLLVRHIIPWRELAEIAVGTGLEFRLRDGRRIGSLMYGSSIIGLALGYRYTRAVAEKMRATQEAVSASAGSDASGAMAYSRSINFSLVPPLVILVAMEGIASLSLIS